MGIMRKALFVATFGVSGLVFKDNSKKERTTKTAAKQVRPKQAKSTRPRPRTTRRPAPRAAGTTNELERLADLYGREALTDEEFAAAKAKILGTSPVPPRARREPAAFPAIEANIATARNLADLAGNDRGPSAATISGD
jgi:hypothetical protein